MQGFSALMDSKMWFAEVDSIPIYEDWVQLDLVKRF